MNYDNFEDYEMMKYYLENPEAFLKLLEESEKVQGLLDNTYVGKTFRDFFTNDFKKIIFDNETLPAHVSTTLIIAAVEFYEKGSDLFHFDFDDRVDLKNNGLSEPLGFFVELLNKNKIEEELVSKMAIQLGTMTNEKTKLFAMDYKEYNDAFKKDFIEETIYQMFCNISETKWFKHISKLENEYEMITRVVKDDFDLMIDLTSALYSLVYEGEINKLFFTNPPIKQERAKLVNDFLLETKFYFENNRKKHLY